MSKSDYTEIHYLPGEKSQPQIKIDAEALLDLLLRAELMMTKVDRIRYATPAIVMIQDVIKEIVLAYDFDDDREIHLKRMCANIAVFISMMRIIGRRNAICLPCAFERETPDSIKRQIVEHLAKLDEGATKWRKSVMRNRGSRARRASSDDPAVPQVIRRPRSPKRVAKSKVVGLGAPMSVLVRGTTRTTAGSRMATTVTPTTTRCTTRTWLLPS